jgi:F-type H+-transporting ATPase subunit b
MMGLTWLTFGLMALVLYKVAWKPILAGLAKRESDIRKALEEAQKTRDEYALIEQKRQQAIAEADAKAKEIVDAARQAAVDAAAVIEAKAREESQILLANAQREIKTAQEKAVDSLRRESADLAIGLSRKIIGANLDDARSRELVDRILRTM